MNNFWKRKVPAFLLTLVMLASLAPAALAVTPPASVGDCDPGKIHSWGSGIVHTEPTCTAKGTRVYVCPNCKKSFTEEIPATGDHDFRVVSGGTPATCTTKGKEKLKMQ